jgi:hypothetical protein
VGLDRRAADDGVGGADPIGHPCVGWEVEVRADEREAEVLDRIAAAGIALPVDYEWFGRSFDGIDYRFIEPLSRHAAEDYRRVLDWFPLAELELMRHAV